MIQTDNISTHFSAVYEEHSIEKSVGSQFLQSSPSNKKKWVEELYLSDIFQEQTHEPH